MDWNWIFDWKIFQTEIILIEKNSSDDVVSVLNIVGSLIYIYESHAGMAVLKLLRTESDLISQDSEHQN